MSLLRWVSPLLPLSDQLWSEGNQTNLSSLVFWATLACWALFMCNILQELRTSHVFVAQHLVMAIVASALSLQNDVSD